MSGCSKCGKRDVPLAYADDDYVSDGADAGVDKLCPTCKAE